MINSYSILTAATLLNFQALPSEKSPEPAQSIKVNETYVIDCTMLHSTTLSKTENDGGAGAIRGGRFQVEIEEFSIDEKLRAEHHWRVNDVSDGYNLLGEKRPASAFLLMPPGTSSPLRILIQSGRFREEVKQLVQGSYYLELHIKEDRESVYEARLFTVQLEDEPAAEFLGLCSLARSMTLARWLDLLGEGGKNQQ